MRLVPDSESLREANSCHTPAGTPQGGQFCSGDGVPAEPGSLPIPEGTVRRFHVTRASAGTIRREGLRMAAAKGIEGPRAIYGWSTHTDALNYGGRQQPVVEYYITKAEADYHPVAVLRDIPPAHIVAVHEPWHDMYRRAVQDGYEPEVFDGIDLEHSRVAAALRRRARATRRL